MRCLRLAFWSLVVILPNATASNAQDPPSVTVAPEAVQCAEYFGCLHYGILTEAQARTARGHPQFMEPHSETAPSASKLSATPDRGLQASRIVAPSHQ
jgi:hypothetical protein